MRSRNVQRPFHVIFVPILIVDWHIRLYFTHVHAIQSQHMNRFIIIHFLFTLILLLFSGILMWSTYVIKKPTSKVHRIRFIFKECETEAKTRLIADHKNQIFFFIFASTATLLLLFYFFLLLTAMRWHCRLFSFEWNWVFHHVQNTKHHNLNSLNWCVGLQWTMTVIEANFSFTSYSRLSCIFCAIENKISLFYALHWNVSFSY